MRLLIILIISTFTIISCSKTDSENTSSSKTESYPIQIAEHYGVNEFSNVESLKFSFNVQAGERNFKRNWEYYPQEERIVSISADNEVVEYTKGADLDSTQLKADQGFVNDTFWLIFPHQLKWGEGTYEYEVEKNTKAPISGEEVTKLTIQYNDEVGYTPGDAYDLFIRDDNTVIEWIFRQGGQEAPSRIMTWEDTKDFNGQKIATMHSTKEGDFKLWLDDIEVNLKSEE